MPTVREAAVGSGRRDLSLVRTIDAPRDLVWQAWTNADHFARWFGPRRMMLSSCRIDPRPGGAIRFCHHFPGGEELWLKGRYLEVVEPERLVFLLSFVDEKGRPARHPFFADWPLDAVFVTTVTLADKDGRTALSIRQAVTPEAAAASDVVGRERELAGQGWIETIDRLADHLATL